jgi:DNA-binding response OmpR family regulator
MRILVVEDEPAIAATLAQGLAQAGFVPLVAADGETGWASADVDPFAAAILDLGLPRLDGLSVLRRWRADGIALPVLVLSARPGWTERVEALNAGADDFLVKPFAMDEVIARLRAILRRAAGLAVNRLEAGGLVIDLSARRATLDGAELALTPLEFRLLKALVHRPGEPVSQVDLAGAVYAHHDSRHDNAIEAAIARLRRKVGHGRIRTRRGYGYVWSWEDGDEA